MQIVTFMEGQGMGIEKVYCTDCKHFAMEDSLGRREGECYAPQNIWKSDSYLKHHKQPRCVPKWINRKNNCRYFESG